MTRASIAKPAAPGVGRPPRRRRRGLSVRLPNEPTSDTAATQVFRTLAVGRPAADEGPAAADEAPAAQPLPAAGVRGLPAAEAREPAAAQDEAWEGPPPAQGGCASPRASGAARQALPPSAKPARELPEAQESPSTAPRLAVSRRHSASALERSRVLAPAVSARR
jgi:hypothetical protein